MKRKGRENKSNRIKGNSLQKKQGQLNCVLVSTYEIMRKEKPNRSLNK